MRFSVRGFSTLAAAALLLLLAALAAVSVSEVETSLNAESRTRRILEKKAAQWDIVHKTLEASQTRWRASEQEWVDFVQTLELGTPVEFNDLSGRINLNGVNTFLLGDSLLRSTLKGGSVQAFAEYRTNKGPFSSLDSYKDFFDQKTLDSLYTTWSVLDVNTVDELAAESIAALRSANPGVGASLREALRTARLRQVVFDQATWEAQSAQLDAALAGVFGSQPEINVNTASETLLEAILTYAALEVTEPRAKLALLLAQRSQRRWTPETLAAALGVEKGARVLQYLGTQSFFLEGTIAQDQGPAFRFVMHRLPGDDAHPEIRLVAQGDAL